ncbi:MAG: hypothetical protein WDN27_06990 [Candidatus Saccharibacteria bacterium]
MVGWIYDNNYRYPYQIGDSTGVTISAKDLKRDGLKPGDTIKLSYEPVVSNQPDTHTVEIVDLTQKLIARHKKALDNLAQR